MLAIRSTLAFGFGSPGVHASFGARALGRGLARKRSPKWRAAETRAGLPPCTVTFETPVAAGGALTGYGCIAPHPHKVKKGGEDALFFDEGSNTVALFDGVGGWAEQGVDPGLYSRGLAKLLQDNISRAKGRCDPGALAKLVDQAVEVNNREHRGTTTACLVSLGPSEMKSRTLYGLNVGDSGFLIIRNDEGVVYRSADQTGIGIARDNRRIAFPYQVGTDGHSAVDDGDQYIMEVQDLDVIVMGTDGMLDNVYDADVDFLVKKVKEESNFDNDGEYMRALARAITLHAFATSLDPEADIPLRLKEMELSPSEPPMYGGKPDDITVACYMVNL